MMMPYPHLPDPHLGYAELAWELFGQEAAPAEAQSEGGGGQGQGQGQGQGGTAAVGMAISAVAGVAGAALQLGNDPREISRTNTNQFAMGLSNLEALQAEWDRARAQHRNAVWWLRNPANKLRWVTNAAAMRAAPRGSKVCPPLYPHPTFMAAVGEKEAPGGHASGPFGALCKCPTHKCAYKPEVRAMMLDKQRIAQRSRGDMWKIMNRRGKGLGCYACDAGLGEMQGNIRDARARTIQSWSLLMGIDSMGSVYALQGIIAPFRDPRLSTPDTLRKLFPGDTDAEAGRIPIFMRDTAVATALSLYGGGAIPASFTLPLWTYGFDNEEARRWGTGPLIAQVATVQARMGSRMSGDVLDYRGWSAGPQGGQGELFGATQGSANASLQATIKDLVETRQMARVPSSPPAAIPPAQIQQTEQAMAQGERNRDSDATGPLVAKIGVGVGLLGLLGLGVYALSSS